MTEEYKQLRTWEEANALIAKLKSELSEAEARGIRSVVYIRCMKHMAVAQLNHNEITGAECGACAQEEAEKRGAKDMLNYLCGAYTDMLEVWKLDKDIEMKLFEDWRNSEEYKKEG